MRPGRKLAAALLLASSLLTAAQASASVVEAPPGAGAPPYVGAPPVDGPPELPAAGPTPFERAKQFRRTFGLPADDTHVGRLQAQARPPAAQYGVPLTDEELADLTDREKVAGEGHRIRRWAEERYRAQYGSQYVDQLDGGRIVVLFTEDAAARLQEIKGFFPFPDRVAVRTVEHSLDELRRKQVQVREAAHAVKATGVEVAYTDIDEIANRVVVAVPEVKPGVQAALDALFGPNFVTVVAGARPTAPASRYWKWSPLRAGTVVRSYSSGTFGELSTCSHAFTAYKGESGGGTSFWLMTAGHCAKRRQGPSDGNVYANINSLWGQATNNDWRVSLGTTQYFAYGRDMDVTVIQLRSDVPVSGCIYYASAIPCQRTSIVEGKYNDQIGQTVCYAGIRYDHTRCGTLSNRHLDTTYDDGTRFYPSIELGGLRTISNVSAAVPGDSGGAVFSGGETVMGIVSGYTGTDRTHYSHVDVALGRFGLWGLVLGG